MCKICVYGAPGAQVDKGQWELWDQICVGHILETTGPIFMIKKAKAIWKPLDPKCALAWSFSLDVPWGLKRAIGAQILCSIDVGDHWVHFQDSKNIPMSLDLRYMLGGLRWTQGAQILSGINLFRLLGQFSGFESHIIGGGCICVYESPWAPVCAGLMAW